MFANSKSFNFIPKGFNGLNIRRVIIKSNLVFKNDYKVFYKLPSL